MICIDTTVMIDEFRARGDLYAPVNRALIAHRNEELVIPAVVAGEFLDGAVSVSEERLQQALALLRTRRIIHADLDVAELYGRIVSFLRTQNALSGRSHNDVWIAATARHMGAHLLTRNPRHFDGIPNVAIIGYH